mgnify:CR=1 FL=1
MVLELKQDLKLSQQLVMTPLLQQAIKLLQLSRLELIEVVRQELETNPVLEDAALEADSQEEIISEPEELKSNLNSSDYEESEWEAYVAEYTPFVGEKEEDRDEFPSLEAFATKQADLKEHLLWQLGMTELGPKELEIGDYIIGNLNEDGYLEITSKEIADELKVSEEDVERVLSIIQNFDPVGVAGRDLKETLLIQASFHGYKGTIVESIIKDYLTQLAQKDFEGIQKALNITTEELKEAIQVIQGLDPRPGRNYSTERPTYITPDVYVIKVGDEYQIILNEDGLPKLRISRYYRDALSNRVALSPSEKEYIKDKMKSASWLIKSIHQRQKTLYKVTESIMKFQREFLEKGTQYLKPLVLRDVAEDINMHESTVSRITTNKYVHTPQGIYELKYFFNSSVGMLDGTAVASESVKELIKNIIKNEDKRNPYSDKEIAEILLKYNIKIARRTVAKYREALKILPSKQRIETV